MIPTTTSLIPAPVSTKSLTPFHFYCKHTKHASSSRIHNQPMRLKLGPHHLPHVLHPMKRPQEPFQLQKLRVMRVVEPRFDGNAVVDIVSERVGAVVDEDGPSEITAEYGEVFEEISLDGEAGVAEHAMADKFSFFGGEGREREGNYGVRDAMELRTRRPSHATRHSPGSILSKSLSA